MKWNGQPSSILISTNWKRSIALCFQAFSLARFPQPISSKIIRVCASEAARNSEHIAGFKREARRSVWIPRIPRWAKMRID